MKIRKTKKQAHFSNYQLQKAFVDSLAIPKLRVEKWKPKSTWSSGVRRSALRGQCTRLIQILARPLPRHIRENAGETYYVRKSALRGKPTPWNLTSALPKLSHVSQTKTRYYRKLGPRQQAATNSMLIQLMKMYKETHPPGEETNEVLMSGLPVHKKCWKDPRGDKERRYICKLSKKERKDFQTRMIQMGQPKEIIKPPKPPRGPKKPLKDFEPALKTLTKPRPVTGLPPRDPFKVKASALGAVASPWIEDLARHREPRPPAPVYDFRGNEILPPRKWDMESRRRVVASTRTEELAVPKRVKKKAVEDMKEDPFMVSRAALNAQCSERVAKLAQPITRD